MSRDEEADIPTGETTIFVRCFGSGSPLLLLHGFPETHAMWRDVASRLAGFRIVCADLRGYGRSGCPDSAPDHAPYSKRAMAADMVRVMEHLGYTHFSVAGHDRGGRVAYRMALDAPSRVDRLAVLDVLPVEEVWERANAEFAVRYWPWSLLAQPEPFPERILERAGDAVVESSLGGWGTPLSVFPQDIRNAYVQSITDPQHAHAICEEYRAAASIDREHDRADRKAGRRIQRPTLVLWSEAGALGTWYANEGGPLSLWRKWSGDVRGRAIRGGHFFPEEMPAETAVELQRFFGEH